MQRLTTKIVFNYVIPSNVENIELLVINKCGKYEDIEEQLGISLDVFVKMFYEGIYVGNEYYSPSGFSFEYGRIKLPCYYGFEPRYLSLCDYGKTWCLKSDRPQQEIDHDKYRGVKL